MLRALLTVNLLAAVAALLRNAELARLVQELVEMAGTVEPPLITTLVVLHVCQPLLARMKVRSAVLVVMLLAVAICVAFAAWLSVAESGQAALQGPVRAGVFGALAALAVLIYFEVKLRVQSPALAEARLAALTARIRPHFLYNSLNAVLGVLRDDPRRAEAALESLAELFRALMGENRQLTQLADELALCEQYLELERLRLGSRLAVRWDVDAAARAALVPPLMLQPLLENAVYYGVEPSAVPCEVGVTIARRGDQVRIEISNAFDPERRHTTGNRMALENIRERLALFFDLEAELETQIEADRYRVRIRLPYREQSAVGVTA